MNVLLAAHQKRLLCVAVGLVLAGLGTARPAAAAATPPETTITSAPSALVNSRNAIISFSSDNPLATFQCSVDDGAYVACLNPRPVLNRPDGPHVFRVRAVAGGLIDPTPAETFWTIDATAPTVTVTPSRPADGKGWYRSSVSFTTTGTDAGGSVTCSDPQTYDGPDVSHFAIVGTCTDLAGNKASKTFDLRYDTTAPAVRVAFRVRDSNGWYNRPFNVTFLGTDTGSGGVICGPGVGGVQHYAGPDTPSGVLNGFCTDAAGNSASMSFPFAYDDTPPDVTASASRTPDVDSWYNAPLTVSFDGTDAMSGGVTCDAPVRYAGPDSGAATVTGNCMDAAGNPAPASLGLAYDATAPTVTATVDRAPDHNGWYNAPTSVAFSGQDSTSGGVSCDPAGLYGGPDTAAATIVGSCSDAAGNFASGSLDLAYDATAPTVTVDPSRVADHNGWFNSAVTFATNGADATSGLVSCSLPVTYFAPDTAAGSLSGSCSDAAGNTATRSASFKYDSTAPTARAVPNSQPNLNGWYRTPFSVSFDGTDATSGPVTCSPASTYSGPDSAAGSLSGACVDQAGNSSPAASYSFKYDATAPSVSALLSRVADKNGWYNHAVDATFSGVDATSKGVACNAPTYSGPDSAAASLSGSCTDAAGNSGSASIGFKYDATGPTVTATPARAANANGWYRASININFTGADAISGPASCDAPASYGGPDTASATLSGSCTDLAGNSGSGSFTLKYDATAPTVSAVLGRAPDAGTWYNHAVSAGFSGTDALSGGVTCDPAKSYASPDSATASLSGSCADAAGNQGTATTAFSYDATAPTVTVSATRPPDSGSAYNSPVTFNVTGSDAMSGGVVCDGPTTYTGPDSTNAIVNGACTDAASNRGTASATFIYQASLPPDTSLISTPAPLTNHTTDQFVFASTKTPSTFKCTIDGATSSCTSPITVTGLIDGQHTFSVAATDVAGNSDPTPATFTWTVDTVVPDTSFTDFPVDPSNTVASFTIQTDADATLECSLDNAAFAACTSPVSLPLSSLPDGSHTFRARGVDGAGNIDATPASLTWTVDTVVPTVTLTSTPSSVSTSTSATFNWSANEPSAFSCRVDTTAFAPCGTGLATTGTKTFNGLAAGSHTFNIRARDNAGNITPAPGVSFTWTVNTGPPDTLIDLASEPTNPTASASATFTFSSTKSLSTFKCKLDNAAAFTACTSPQSYTGLTGGSHTFSVEAIDSLNNVDPTPAAYTWLVDITNPSGALSAPLEGATVSATTAVTTSATDNVSVLNVQFKLDGADLGTPLTSAPFTLNWDTTIAADGPHTLTAVIRDEVNNLTTTAPVHVTVSNVPTHPVATQSPDLVDVGPGSVDATTRNVMRTASGRVYIIANDDQGLLSRTSTGVIHAYKGNQLGTPTAFAEVDAAHRPVSGSALTAFGGVDVRLGSDGIARAVYNDNSFGTTLIYRPFSTVTDTWGTAETIASNVGTMDRGKSRFAMALDAANVPHVVWVTGCTSSLDCTNAAGGETLNYSNRAGGTWSTPVTITISKPLHPMLAFDSTGVLHLSWLEDNGTTSTIKYATRTGTTWSAPETVPTAATGVLTNGNADQGPSIATDSAGHPYVLYVGASKGTFGPAGHTALYGAIKVVEKVGGAWTDVSPATDMLTHTPQVYLNGNDLYAFSGHDTAIHFSYNHRFPGLAWGSETELTSILADGSASIRWDPLHETDSSIIDATTFNEDRLGNHSFLPELYYMAVKPSVADPTAPTVSLTAPAAGTITGTVAMSANASDNIGVAGVTFMVDGSSIAAEDTTSPYSVNWNSATATNGSHTLTAVARDGAGNVTTSAPVTVSVSNAVPAPAPGAVLFGSATIFTPTDTNLPGTIEAFDVGPATAGSLARMHVFLDAPLPATVLVGLYADSAGAPGTLLSSTAIVTPIAGWNDVAFGPVSLVAGSHYWVALLAPTAGATGPHFRDAKTGGAGIFVNGLGLSALPGSWPSGGTKNTDGPLAAWGSS